MKKTLLFILIVLTCQVSMAQVINTEGFEDGSMPPAGWSLLGSSSATSYWHNSGAYYEEPPSAYPVSPHTGSRMAYFDSWDAAAGVTATLVSPVFSRIEIGSTTDSVSLWVYRDNVNASKPDSVAMYISTTADYSGASLLGVISRNISDALPVTEPSAGWYYYSFVVPSGFNGSSNYLLIRGGSGNGDNVIIDDITWTAWPPACSGTPTAGIAAGPSSSICPSTLFGVYVTGDSLSSGLTYQWYSSPSGADVFTADSAASTLYYNSAGIDTPTDYYLVVTCTTSGLSDTSTTTSVAVNPAYLCDYCTGVGGDPYDYAGIDSISILGTTLHNATADAPYTYYPPGPGTTATLMTGLTYEVALKVSSADYTEYSAYLWVDYDHSGSYDATEYTKLVTNGPIGVVSAGVFTIPSSADTGVTGFRIRTSAEYYTTLGSGSACTYEYDGSTEDYHVRIVHGVACSGTPAAGTVSSSSPSVCASPGKFNLIDAGATIDSGIAAQWYSSPSGAGTWTAMTSAFDTAMLTTGISISATTDYIYVVTCGLSSTTDTSNVLTVDLSPFYLCYCSPLTGTTLEEDAPYYYGNVNNVTIAGTTLNYSSPGSPTSELSYVQNWPTTPTTTATLMQGSYYTLSVTNDGGTDDYAYIVAAWIDYGRTGTYTSTDNILDIDSYTGAVPAGSTATASFIVPVVPADTGLTGMRVRVDPYFYDGYLTTSDYCNTNYDGVTVDFVINIAPGITCTGYPTPGTVLGPASACSSTGKFNLSDTGFTNEIGMAFQWYSSPTGTGTWTALTEPTSTSPEVTGLTVSAATDFIFVATCDSSGYSDTSNVLTVNLSPFYLCYCGPATGTVLNLDYLDNIDSFAIAGTTLNNYTPASGGTPTPLYLQYWPTTASTTTTLTQGSFYSAYIKVYDEETEYYGYTETDNASMWIDYDHSGTFDASEWVGIESSGTSPHVYGASFAVSDSAVTGLTGLRVRAGEYYSIGSGTACNTDVYDGTTRDYIISIDSGTFCSGYPVPGTAYASSAAVCTGTYGSPFSLYDTAFTEAIGMSYQWYSSPSGAGTWTSLYGGASPSVSGVTQDTVQDYIMVATCSSSSIADTSNIVTVNASPFYLCYCGPATGTTLASYYEDYLASIDYVGISGTTLSDYLTTTSSTPDYTFFYPTTPSTTGDIAQGGSYTISVLSDGGLDAYAYNAVAWIDYDHSGTYDAGENILNVADVSPGTTSTASFSVPGTADTGLTGFRVRANYSDGGYYYYAMGASDACSNKDYSYTVEYLVNIVSGSACTGTPVAGTPYSSVPTVCASTESFMLEDTGFSEGTGLTYQWLSSPTGAASWTAISGATGGSYSTTEADTLDYIFTVYCSNSATYDTSAVLTVGTSPFYLCYCGPNTGTTLEGYWYDYESSLDGVSISGTTLDYSFPTVTSTTPTYFWFWPTTATTTATMSQGDTYTASVLSDGGLGGEAYNAVAWIDFDHSGTFDAGEAVLVGANVSAGTTTTHTFSVPGTADTGLTGFRVRVNFSDGGYYYYAMGTGDACSDKDYAITADFVVDIAPGIPCSGAPSAGTILTSASTVCLGSQSFNLVDTGASAGTGLTYSWYSSTSGAATWTSVYGASGATASSVTESVASDYIFVAYCANSGLYDTSAILTVGGSPFYLCYCGPNTGATLATYSSYYESSLDGVSISGTTLDYSFPSVTSSTPVYFLFWPTTSTTTGTIAQGDSYTASVLSDGGIDGESYNAVSWIDYNHDGTFESGESIISASNVTAGSATTATFTVPGSADTGLTGYRVRVNFSDGGYYYYAMGTSDACSEKYYAVTADFVIDIAAGIPCSGHPSAGTPLSSRSTVCSGGLETITLSDTGYSTGTGLSYQWFSSTSGAGAFGALSGDTAAIAPGIGQDTATDYYFVAYCANSGLYDTSAVITVGNSPFYFCYCQPALGSPLYYETGYPYVASLDQVSVSGTTLNYSFPSVSTTTPVYQLMWPTTSTTTGTMAQATSHTLYVLSDGGLDGYAFNAAAWLDYNHDGIFETSENIMLVSNESAGSDATATFSIPGSADTGLTGLRVRVDYSDAGYYYYAITSSEPCYELEYGYTADFIVNLRPGVPCSGTPAGGTAYSSLSSACSSAQTFTLTDTGATLATGIVYQWFSSPHGTAAWDTLTIGSGTNSTNVSGVYQDSATDYMMVTYCTASGLSDTAYTNAAAGVAVSPFYLCYCQPSLGSPLYYETGYPYVSSLDGVSVSGTTLNYSFPSVSTSTPVYELFWPTTSTTTGSMAQATTHTIHVLSDGGLDDEAYNVAAWIDYDQNGTFAASENIMLVSDESAGSTAAQSFTVPVGADTGLTGLRVRVDYSDFGYYYYAISSSEACSELEYGYTADFIINIRPGVPCTGAPTAGTAYGPSAICASSTLTLTDTGSTEATAITYAWLYSPHGSGVWDTIAGAHSTTYTSSQDSSTDYSIVVTCTASGYSDTSASFTVLETPFYGCYCGPTTTGITLGSTGYYDEFDSIKILGSTTPVLYSATSTSVYVSVPPTTVTDTVTAASTYSVGVGVTCYYSFSEEYTAGMWIDYDHSGTFDAGEFTNIVPTEVSTGSSGSAGTTYYVPFTVPGSATSGITGMRFRTFEYAYVTSTDACYDEYESQTVDFALFINPAPACSGTPTAGVASASTGSACDSTTVTLSDPAAFASTGLTFQWLTSVDGGTTWSNLAGATTELYSFTGLDTNREYKLAVYCTGSSTGDTSNVVTIHKTACYCIDPQYYYPVDYSGEGATQYNEALNIVDIWGAGGTHIHDTGICTTASYGGYLDHTGLTAITMQQGGSYSITATYGESLYGMENQVWIDFSDSGSFISYNPSLGEEATDTVSPVFGYVSGSYETSGSSFIMVPSWAPAGYHRMRVRNVWSEIYSGTYSTELNVCAISDAASTYYHGAVVDYTVYIAPSVCDSVTGVTATATSATSASISWTGASGSAGYWYTVTTSATPPADTATGTFTTASSATKTGLSPATTYYAWVLNSCGVGDYSTWQSAEFMTDCSSVGTVTVTASTDTSVSFTWPAVGGALGYEYAVGTSTVTPTSFATTSGTSATVSDLLAGTVYYVFVKDTCTGGSWSAASTAVGTTGFCDSIAGSTVLVNANDTGVIFSFTSVGGSAGYYYVVNTSATTTTGGIGGTHFTTSTTDTLNGLTPGNSYYLHLETGCGSGYSAWTAVPFTTSICDTVTAVITTSTDTSISFSFTGSATGGYNYIVSTSSVTPTSLTGSTHTTATSGTVTGLSAGTTYYLYILGNCSGGYSSWTATTTNTGACDTVSVTAYANDTIAYITWVAAPGAAGYDFYYDTNPTASGTGTFTSATADTITSGLVAGTTYFAHVRVSCGGGAYSAWQTVAFQLSPCDTTAVIVNTIGSHSVSFGWIPQAGAAGYWYIVNTSPSNPTSTAGAIFTTADTASWTGLTDTTTYYIHLEVACGIGSGLSSGWTETGFNTISDEAVVNVNNNQFDMKAFPNPAINTVTVKVSGTLGNNRVVELTDITGKTIKRVNMTTDQVDVDVSDVAAAIYFIKYTDDDRSQVIKINKQ